MYKKNLQIYKTRKEYINKTRQVKIQKEKKPLINTAGFAKGDKNNTFHKRCK